MCSARNGFKQGCGKIGKVMINILKGFGMRVLVYDSYKDEKYTEENGFKYCTLDKIYSEADIISLHCPLSPETNHLINKDSIDKMKQD